jgi:hypothetical protein
VQASAYEKRGDGTYGAGCTPRPQHDPGTVPGSIAWAEHVEAWRVYAARCAADQTADRVAERGGFDWYELCSFLGREPRTWRPVLEGSRP